MVLLHEGAIASATAAWAILLDRSAVARKRPNSRRLPLAGVRKPLTKTDLYVLTRTDAIAAIGRTAFDVVGTPLPEKADAWQLLPAPLSAVEPGPICGDSCA
jgi:hypothetical protein